MIEKLSFSREPKKLLRVGSADIQVFESQDYGVNEFSIEDAAAIHDRAMAWLHKVHGTTEEGFRNSLVARLPENADGEPLNILVTACGAGNDFPYLFQRYPDARFWIQDFAEEMLEAAIVRHSEAINSLHFLPTFFVSDASRLPFQDSVFDVVFHFGGLNLYEDVPAGVSEMHRVAVVGGTIFFGDEGMAPWVRSTEVGQVLATNNSLYLREPPLEFLPLEVMDFCLEYRFNNCFYVIHYKKSSKMVLDFDVEHEGRRGGSLHTRYFGKLEGINPEVRDRLYQIAESRGLSRVRALEEAVKEYIAKEG